MKLQGKKIMNKLGFILLLMVSALFTACVSIDPVKIEEHVVDKEKRAVYEEQKKREAIDRSQRESDAGGRRLDKAIKN